MPLCAKMKLGVNRLLLLITWWCVCVPMGAQRVTLSLQRVTVKRAMHKLNQATGYSFVYFSADVDVRRRVSVVANQASIHSVVGQILQGQDVTFEIKEKSVIVRRVTPKTLPLPSPPA